MSPTVVDPALRHVSLVLDLFFPDDTVVDAPRLGRRLPFVRGAAGRPLWSSPPGPSRPSSLPIPPLPWRSSEVTDRPRRRVRWNPLIPTVFRYSGRDCPERVAGESQFTVSSSRVWESCLTRVCCSPYRQRVDTGEGTTVGDPESVRSFRE